MSKHHDLKIDPTYYAQVESGEKPFEVRLNDRAFKSGDTVTLHEYDRGLPSYTGQRLGPFVIGYVLEGGVLGLPAGWCVFGLLKPASNELTEREASMYQFGFEDGVRCYAHYASGVQYVGTTGKTLKAALENAKDSWNFNTHAAHKATLVIHQ